MIMKSPIKNYDFNKYPVHVHKLLEVLWIYSYHIQEILDTKKYDSCTFVTMLRDLETLHKLNGADDSYLEYMQFLREFYDPDESIAIKNNAGLYFMSYKPKYIKFPAPIEATTGMMHIWDYDIQTKWQLLPRLKTLSIAEHVVNILQNHTILVDIGTWTGAIPLFIIQQDKNKNIDKALGYDTKHTLAFDWKELKHYPWGASTWEHIEQDLIDRNIFPDEKIIITANLPYGTEEDYNKYPDRVKNEPIQALLGWWNDGLDIYRTYINWLSQSKFLHKIKWIIFEWWSKNISLLFDLCKQSFTKFSVELLPDCFGKNRFVQIKQKHNLK